MSIAESIIVALLLADFLSGLFHWWEDRYGNPDWPIIGPLVVEPNIEHHLQPTKFTEQGYWVLNSTTIFPAALAAFAVYPLNPPWWTYLALLFLSQANQIHAWSHKKPPEAIRLLQQCGILISPTQHNIHHRVPFSNYFCTVTQFLNPILTAVDFWRWLEWLVYLFSGIKTRPERATA